MVVHLGQPVIQVLEAGSVEDVEHQHYSISTLVICVSDGPVSFLAGSVPNLELQLLSAMSERPKPKIDSDSRDIVLIKFIVCKPDEQTALADAGVS